MIYVTSDLHGYHKNICYGTSDWDDKLLNCRDFPDFHAMNYAIAESINNELSKGDTLIELGDFAFGSWINVFSFRKMLRVNNIIHINGNHDKLIKRDAIIPCSSDIDENVGLRSLFTEVHDAPYIFTYKGYEFICSHYPPQASTNFNKPNTVWLHGHCHNKNNYDEIHIKYNVFDVCWNGKVFSLDEIINNLKY